MIIVTGTKRSGTSLWMHLLVAAGLPLIGERFPSGWGALLEVANPDGYFESELIAGVYYLTNPHPLTGAYLAPAQTRQHAVKVFIPGLIRTDVAFIDRCVATVRDWRAYVASMQRLRARQVAPLDTDALSLALRWWQQNFALIRDFAIRGYPGHVVSYDGLLRDPGRAVSEVIEWLGVGDADRALDRVIPRPATEVEIDGDASVEGLSREHVQVFDELYATIDEERPLSPSFIRTLNRTDEALRPRVLEMQARADARGEMDREMFSH